uniref:IS66 family transposase n=1 Tax=Heyndrickxia sporothermodurans TaxID=46224 RepID=UPI0036D36D32
MTLFQSALSRARSVLESFIEGFSGTIVCDGYSAYDKLEGVNFANCWAHVRRYWLKADSKNGRIGVKYCDDLYRLERQFKRLSPSKRRKNVKSTRSQSWRNSFTGLKHHHFTEKCVSKSN